jgi:hypothetical protein
LASPSPDVVSFLLIAWLRIRDRWSPRPGMTQTPSALDLLRSAQQFGRILVVPQRCIRIQAGRPSGRKVTGAECRHKRGGRDDEQHPWIDNAQVDFEVRTHDRTTRRPKTSPTVRPSSMGGSRLSAPFVGSGPLSLPATAALQFLWCDGRPGATGPGRLEPEHQQRKQQRSDRHREHRHVERWAN